VKFVTINTNSEAFLKFVEGSSLGQFRRLKHQKIERSNDKDLGLFFGNPHVLPSQEISVGGFIGISLMDCQFNTVTTKS